MAAGPPSADPEVFQFLPTIWLMTAPTNDPPTPPYLEDTPIHPIFQEQNWIGPSGEPKYDDYGMTTYRALWLEMGPAFRLASKFLTADACLSWWATLIVSGVTQDPSTQRRYLPTVPSTPHTRARVQQVLNDLAPNIRFRYSHNVGEDSFAIFIKRNNISLVYLHVAYIAYLVGTPGVSSDFSRAHPSRRLCFFASLAIVLVHEVAHAVSRNMHGGPSQTLAPRPEPFHSLTDPEVEMGASWTNSLFMGQMATLNDLRSASKGLVWWRWRTGQGHGKSDTLGEGRYWGVYMAWVEALFRELTWRKVDRLGLREIEMRTCGGRARTNFDLAGWRYRFHGIGDPEEMSSEAVA